MPHRTKSRKRVKKPQRPRPVAKRPAKITAGQIMNAALVTVPEDMPVRELAALLTENEITGAPVANRRGKLIGVVSVTDIAQSAAEGADFSPRGKGREFRKHDLEGRASRTDLRDMHVEDEGLPVRDIMTPTVYTVPSDTPVSKIAQTMISGRIHRLLVTRRGRIVGIITALDLLKLLAGRK